MSIQRILWSAALVAAQIFPTTVAAAEIGLVKRVRISAEVFATGQETKDPLLMIAAAKLRKSAHLMPVDRVPNSGGAGTPSGGVLDWSQMLDAAQTLATGDPVLIGLIEDIRAENSKGVVDGPVYSIVKIRASGQDTYDALPFQGGKYAEIYVEGQGSSDLNLFVYDDQSRLVCSDTDISDIAYCGWRPASSGGFTVAVKNKGKADNQYSLITN